MILPAFVLYTFFVVYPIFSAIPYSFFKWSGLGKPEFVGLGNYSTLFTHPMISPDFVKAVQHNVYLLAIAIVILVPLTTLVTYFIYRKIFGNRIIQIILFLPYFINFVVIAFMATLVLDPNFGLASVIMRLLGLWADMSPLLSDWKYSVPFVALVSFWHSMGYSLLLLLAAMVMVPSEMLEAAQIDGSGEWSTFFRVFIPTIRPTLINIVIIHYIWAISLFEIPYLLAGGVTGGVNKSLDFVSTNYYRVAFGGAYISNSVGFGTTMAVVISTVIFFGTMLQVFMLNKNLAGGGQL